MAGPWEDYAATAPQEKVANSQQNVANSQQGEGPWQEYAAPKPQQQPDTLGPDPMVGLAQPQAFSDVARRVDGAMREAFGDDKLGMTDEQFAWMQKHHFFRQQQDEGIMGVARAFNELLIYRGGQGADYLARSFNALYRGAQQLGTEAGLSRDVVSIPDAFMGSPGALHELTPPKPFVEPTPIKPVEYAQTPEAPAPAGPPPPRSRAALTGDPVIDQVIQHPTIRAVIDNAVIDRQHSIPYEAGASEPLSNPTVYVDKHVPQTFTVKRLSDPSATVTFDTGEPMAIHEDVEEPVKQILIAAGWDRNAAWAAAHYGWAEPAEHAWYRAHDIDPDAAEAEWRKLQPKIQHEAATDAPPDLFREDYPEGNVALARHEEVFQGPPSPEDMARARQIVEEHYARQPDPVAALAQARDLGVIGPGKPPIENLPPAEAAAAEVPNLILEARRAAGEDVRQSPGPSAAVDKAGNIRLDQIGINADAKDVIRQAAQQHDDFNDARAGNVPLAQVESLSQASGIPSPVLAGNDGLGRLMHNDAVVRTWLQAFHQASDEIAGKMKEVALGGGEKAIEELREMKLRFAHMQEQVSGLTAEAGRTLAVFREFYDAKGKAEALGKVLEDNPGNDTASLKKLAEAGAALDPAQLPRFLNDMRKPNFWDRYLFYWVNALISGPFTHTGYVLANQAFSLYEAGVTTPIAGLIGALRERFSAEEVDRVYAGEAVARLWGQVKGFPDAMKAAWTAARDNIQVPLPGEVAAGINPVINQRPNPIGGRFGVVVGAPSRMATAIHSFFNFQGYRQAIEAQAYRQAAKEGLSPFSDAFWRRQATIAGDPTEAMMGKAIEEGYRLTFISEQGSFGKAVNKLLNWRDPTLGTQPLKLIIPFNHIPGNILRRSLEQLPASILTDSEVRANLTGRNGAIARDTQAARLIAGSMLGAWAVNLAVGDNLTGYGPTDEKERADWLLTHQPYSVKVNGYWISYYHFGPLGTMLGLVANFAGAGARMKDHEIDEAVGEVTKGMGRLLEDEVGMQGLKNLLDAWDDPDRKGSRFVAGQLASNAPYSSLLRQTASAADTWVRDAKTFSDRIAYQFPYTRQGLPPKRDWLGEPVANAKAFQAPTFGVLGARPVNTDPVALEAQRLQIKPGVPQDRIGGVKLTPALYDRYQAQAGTLARMQLDALVRSPGWSDLPDYVRETAIRHVIEASRKNAGYAMQARYPALIAAGVQQKIDHITGATHTDRPKQVPAALEGLQ